MSLPRELRNRTARSSIALITRTPSHLISNAQPVSTAGNAPVTAFIGRKDSRSSTPHSRTVRVMLHPDEADFCDEPSAQSTLDELRCMKSILASPNRSHASCRYERRDLRAL